MRSRDGASLQESVSHVRSIKDGLHSGMPLLEALKTILEDEKALSEEYVTLLHSKVRVIGEDNTALKRILGDIAADEEKHQALLKLAVRSICR